MQDKRLYQGQRAVLLQRVQRVSRNDLTDLRLSDEMINLLKSGRVDSATENTIVDGLKRDLEEVASFKGSREEQLLMVFCKQTKLRCNKLTEEEKQWLTRIFQKSELAKSYMPQRGKRK